jgi:hypothetical protein
LALEMLKMAGLRVAFNSATSVLTVLTARNRLFCVASMNKAAGLSRMSIPIKQFIGKTQSRRYPSGHGRQSIHRKPQFTPQRVDQWATAQTPDAWRRLTLREGEKDLWVADYLHTQVWVWDGEEDKAHCRYLLVRREVGADSISHYCLSNAQLGYMA